MVPVFDVVGASDPVPVPDPGPDGDGDGDGCCGGKEGILPCVAAGALAVEHYVNAPFGNVDRLDLTRAVHRLKIDFTVLLNMRQNS